VSGLSQKRSKRKIPKGDPKKFDQDAQIQKRFDLDVMAFLSNCSLPYYLTLTIHYISPKFALRKFVVDCRSTEMKKDDQGIASLISSMISSISG